ncbi:MAG TPA: hypothetical protein VFG69_05370 [Nannocystaceae bacterium]|nr:hypothetical protein [Nannocystaceae bacterium]
MRALAVIFLVAACSSDSGDESGGGSGGASGDTAAGDSTAADPSMTGADPACEMVTDCTTCWKCAKISSCKADYDACASSFECAGSLACIDYMCPADGILQPCLDHCCQNCAEHAICFLVDAAVTCIEQECAAYCGDAVCG